MFGVPGAPKVTNTALSSLTPSSELKTPNFVMREEEKMSQFLEVIEWFDETGREIMNLPETARTQGNQKEKITLGNDFKPGVYFVNLIIDNASISKKIVIQ